MTREEVRARDRAKRLAKRLGVWLDVNISADGFQGRTIWSCRVNGELFDNWLDVEVKLKEIRDERRTETVPVIS